MDKLKEELERKRKLKESLAPSSEADGGGKKKKVYMSKGQMKQMAQGLAVNTSSDAGAEGGPANSSPQKEAEGKQAEAAKKRWIPAAEVVSRLRDLKQPIRLFAESDDARIERLRQAELTRPDDEHGSGQKNWQAGRQKEEKDKAAQGDSSDEDDVSPEEKQAKRREKLLKLHIAEEQASQKGGREGDPPNEVLLKCWLKRVLKEWEIDLEEIPQDARRAVKVKKEFETFHQTKAYLKPLYKQLKRKTLELDIIAKLEIIIRSCRSREYVKAADAYLLLSIGKAAWPIGVTMVGIHERSSREKLFASDVAHILNDETQRKFIQSVKRLMTYCQNKYPPDSFTQALEPTCIDTHAPTILKQQGKGDLTGILKGKM